MKTVNYKCYLVPSIICNSECFFCVSNTYTKSETQFMGVNTDQFCNTLNYFKNLGIKKFEITGGGEPYLNENLQDIVDCIRMQIPDSYIKLYTNGIIKKRITGIQELNISTVHWKSEVLVDVYKNERKGNLIEQLMYFYNPEEYLLRLSIPIYRGGIDSVEKARELIRLTKKYVNGYVFRPLLERTPNREELYIDFDIEDDIVEVDRECSCYSKIYLWWTDNHIYDGWSRKNCIF